MNGDSHMFLREWQIAGRIEMVGIESPLHISRFSANLETVTSICTKRDRKNICAEKVRNLLFERLILGGIETGGSKFCP